MNSAVVLSGGAALAAFEVGVIKALSNGKSHTTGNQPLEPDIVTGTSAGALNASLLLSGYEARSADAVARVENVWLTGLVETDAGGGALRIRGNPADFVNPARYTRSPRPWDVLSSDTIYLARQAFARSMAFLGSKAALEQRVIDAVDMSVFVSVEPYHDLVKRAVNLAAVRSHKTSLRIAATNWRNGTARIFENKHMTDASGHDIVLGSGALPGISPTIEVDGEQYADGGLAINTPIGPAIDAGADVLHAVYVNPNVDAIPLPRLSNTLSTVYRTLAITLAVGFDQEIRRAERINAGIEVMERARSGQPWEGEHMQGVADLLGSLSTPGGTNKTYRKLTIHRYFLPEAAGVSQWLDFKRPNIEHLIDSGYRSTVAHDCKKNCCIGV